MPSKRDRRTRDRDALMPSAVSPHVGWFDRFAGRASRMVSRAWFFASCVLLVVIWAPTLVFLDINTSQLLINTATTIVTFLLVALLQNTAERQSKASEHKLNAIADALSELMAVTPGIDARHERELRAAVGVERRESS